MSNPFGKKLEYNPVPQIINWEIVGREQSGKSSLLAKLAKPGICLVVDSDGRFNDVIPKNSPVEFYPISDNKQDMLNVDKIVAILEKGVPQVNNVTMIAVDTLTKILEPIIQRIQDTGKTNVYSYKEKSDAMKKLRHVLTKWGVETAWIYHIKEYLEKEIINGKTEYVTKEKDFLTDIEYGRLGQDITVTLEVIVADNAKRGIYVRMARRGRNGITYWDESGTWENARQNLENLIWGNLTEEEQTEIETTLPKSFVNAGMAVRWAWDNYPHLWKDAQHTQNSLKKLNEELKEQLGEELYSLDILWEKWIEKVTNKSDENS